MSIVFTSIKKWKLRIILPLRERQETETFLETDKIIKWIKIEVGQHKIVSGQSVRVIWEKGNLTRKMPNRLDCGNIFSTNDWRERSQPTVGSAAPGKEVLGCMRKQTEHPVSPPSQILYISPRSSEVSLPDPSEHSRSSPGPRISVLA